MELVAQVAPSANRWLGRASSLLKRGFQAATGSNGMGKRRLAYSDRRAEHRLKVPFAVGIAGESGPRVARGVDIHGGGALILATRPLAPESLVFFHAKNFGLMGFAQVRHCTARGVNLYAIGVEFPKPLMRDEIGTWQFHRVRQTESGWSVEMEASMNFDSPTRAA
jgi:PilZ domain